MKEQAVRNPSNYNTTSELTSSHDIAIWPSQCRKHLIISELTPFSIWRKLVPTEGREAGDEVIKTGGNRPVLTPEKITKHSYGEGMKLSLAGSLLFNADVNWGRDAKGEISMGGLGTGFGLSLGWSYGIGQTRKF